MNNQGQEYINIDPSGENPSYVPFERIDVTGDGASFYDIFQWARKLTVNEQNYFYFKPEYLKGKYAAFGFNQEKTLIDIWIEDPEIEKKYHLFGRVTFNMRDLIVMVYGIENGKPNFEDSWEFPLDTEIKGGFPIKNGDRLETIFMELFKSEE